MTIIRGQAFFDCKELQSVVIPKGVTRLGAEAFCGGLKVIELPAGLRRLSSKRKRTLGYALFTGRDTQIIIRNEKA